MRVQIFDEEDEILDDFRVNVEEIKVDFLRPRVIILTKIDERYETFHRQLLSSDYIVVKEEKNE